MSLKDFENPYIYFLYYYKVFFKFKLGIYNLEISIVSKMCGYFSDFL